MQQISFEALVDKAIELNQSGTKWHFHMIGPACIFSRTADDAEDRYEIIMEIEETGETIASRFKEKPIDQTHRMAQLVYGADYLNKEKEPEKEGPAGKGDETNQLFLDIMDRARACCAAGKAWHNHHLHPQCRLNPKKGAHCIVFEDETGGEPLYAYYNDEPMSHLAELERLFFDK